MNPIRIYIVETWTLIAEMGPYLILGFLFSGLLHRWIRAQWIEQHLGAPGFRSIAFASLVGVPMPLCSCGVIPVTASLREKGASKGAATSFLTSTPQTGIDSILATYGMLGPVFAFYRVIVAFVSGIVVGAVFERFGDKFAPVIPRATARPIPKATWNESAQYGLVTLPGNIAASLFVGFLIAGLISSLAPDNLLANIPGGVYSSILLTTLIATPFYICSTGSIPLALALIASGLPVSAALVLLIAGPATNIATITTMRKILGGRETAIYVTSIVVVSWIAAFLFHEFFGKEIIPLSHLHSNSLSAWSHTAGGLLLAILAYSYWSQNDRNEVKTNSIISQWDDPEIATFRIEGMTCSHCSESATQALKALPGILHVAVDLKSGISNLGGPGIDSDAISKKLDSIGFSVVNFSIEKRQR